MRRPVYEIGRSWIGNVGLNLDLARGLRASVSLAIALAFFYFSGWSKVDSLYVALTAQAIGLNDFRGGAFFRLSLIVFCTLVMVAATVVGNLAGHSAWAAVIAVVILAALGGIWRQLSTDYGPFLSVNSVLLFLVASAVDTGATAGHMTRLILLGGAIAAGVQMVVWFFRPQQQIRNVLGEVWVRVSDLAAAMRWQEGATERSGPIAARELDLREALDHTFTVLGAEERWRSSPLLTHLEEMRREAVHLTMRLIAFNVAFEALPAEEHKRYDPTVDSAVKALGDAARSTALTLVNYRPANLVSSTMRWTRALRLWQGLGEQLRACRSDIDLEHLQILLQTVSKTIPVIREKLATTLDHPEARWSVPVSLPEMSTQSLRGLTGWVEARWEWDPVIIRYSLRVMVLAGLAMAIYKFFNIPHGYWITLTIIIVLQPDYGSTRARAAQRIFGTLGGVLVSSLILFLNPAPMVQLTLLPLISFGFAYYLKRRYDFAAFFVTILVVLLTGTAGTVHLEFVLWRLGCTVFGGLIALFAAHFFWPVWEQGKLSILVAAALRANARYLQSLFSPEPQPADQTIFERRNAEHANLLVAASLKRMLAEPTRRTATVASQVETVTYLQRFTRALTVILVHQETAGPEKNPIALEAAQHLENALEDLAVAAVLSVATDSNGEKSVKKELDVLENLFGVWSASSSSSPTRVQLMKCAGEIRAMHFVQ